MNAKLRVLAFVAVTIAVTFPSLAFGKYDVDELKREIAKKETRYKEMREARAMMAEYAFDDSYMFVVIDNKNIMPYTKKEFGSWMKYTVLLRLAQGVHFSDDFDPEIWVENEMGDFRRESEKIRKDIKKSLPALDNLCETKAVEIKFLKDRLAELEAGGPSVKGSATVGPIEQDPCADLSGSWKNKVKKTGCNESTWNLSQQQKGNIYEAQESGCGSARGTAEWNEGTRQLHIKWDINEDCKGDYNWTLDSKCKKSVSGSLNFRSNKEPCKGNFTSSVERK